MVHQLCCLNISSCSESTLPRHERLLAMLLCRRLRKEAPGARALVVVILSTLTPKVTGQDGTQLQVEPFVRGCRCGSSRIGPASCILDTCKRHADEASRASGRVLLVDSPAPPNRLTTNDLRDHCRVAREPTRRLGRHRRALLDFTAAFAAVGQGASARRTPIGTLGPNVSAETQRPSKRSDSGLGVSGNAASSAFRNNEPTSAGSRPSSTIEPSRDAASSLTMDKKESIERWPQVDDS
jgi:hypothetical protein